MASIEHSIAHKLGYELTNGKAANSKDRYGFSDADYLTYQVLRHEQINSSQFFDAMQMMPQADWGVETLVKSGHKVYLVTSRGCTNDGEHDEAVRQLVVSTLKKWGILDRGLHIHEEHSFFDTAAKQIDKARQCKSLGITLLIDDDMRNIRNVRQAEIAAIHFGTDAKDWKDVVEHIVMA